MNTHIRTFIRIAVLLAALLPAPLQADTAAGPGDGVLRTSAALSAASALDAWNDGAAAENFQSLAAGFSAEYGVLPWASLAASWNPGALISAYSFTGGSEGVLSDLRFSIRFALLGEQALVKTSSLRLALLTGLTLPLPSGAGTAWEPDAHLWGAAAGLSFDCLPLPFFQVNLSASASWYPDQASDNPAFSRLAVSHPLDLRLELEPRFNALLPRGVVITLPAVYEFSPRSRVRDRLLEDERHALSLGLGYAIAIRDLYIPFETGLKFLFPLYGFSGLRTHRIEFTGRIDIPLKRK